MICPECGGTGIDPFCGVDWLEIFPCVYCDGAGTFPGTALILHPAPETHDPFGVLSFGYVHDLRLSAEGFRDGWEEARRATLGSGGRSLSLWAPGPCTYAEVRDYLHGLVDLPDTVAAAVALWVTRDPAKSYFLSFTVVF